MVKDPYILVQSAEVDTNIWPGSDHAMTYHKVQVLDPSRRQPVFIAVNFTPELAMDTVRQWLKEHNGIIYSQSSP